MIVARPARYFHTPAPWKVTQNDPGCRTIGGSKSNTHKQAQYRKLATTSGVSLGVGGDEEDRANARLIAAAPDLLQKVVGLLTYVPCAEEACTSEDRCFRCEVQAYLNQLGVTTREGLPPWVKAALRTAQDAPGEAQD